MAGAFGGKYKDKDWLGTDIRKPWGMDLMTYLEHRFTPGEHPKDKVYAELDYLDLLDPPQELISKRLRDVPMTDDMQKFWNDTYGALKGTTNPYLIGAPANFTVRVPVLDITTGFWLQVAARQDTVVGLICACSWASTPKATPCWRQLGH